MNRLFLFFSLVSLATCLNQQAQRTPISHPELECQRPGEYRTLIFAEFKLSPYDKCSGSVCDYKGQVANIFLERRPCPQAQCRKLDGPSFETWPHLRNVLFIDNSILRKARTGSQVSQLYGKILAPDVTGRLYAGSGSGRIFFQDFKNAPIIELTDFQQEPPHAEITFCK